jgi:tRNA modification GTPase
MINIFKLKDYRLNDTIAAPATFPCVSALGVIKISGPQAINIAVKIFLPKFKKDLRKAKNFTLHYGYIIDPKKKKQADAVVDEVLLALMRKPNSYTKEDVVEISSHGGPIVINKILNIILNQGCRQAKPGEFTYRAVINGRLDCLQAQGVLDIIEAKTEDSLRLAVGQLRGTVSRRINAVKQEIKELLAVGEALISFPEDELEVSLTDFKRKLSRLAQTMQKLSADSQQGSILKEGLRCVICGRANAGKSTLFNCLIKEERVIVSSLPGTTRDVIEETIIVAGVPLKIYDTAGILEPKDMVTKKAIVRSQTAFNQADLIILVVDGSRSLNKDDYFFLERAREKNLIIVVSKADLKQQINTKQLAKIKAKKVSLSVKTNKGINDLEKAIHSCVFRKGINRSDVIYLNRYQQDLINHCARKIFEALDYLGKGYTIDFVNFVLKESVDSLAKLTGEVFSQEIMEDIFSKFCIGK